MSVNTFGRLLRFTTWGESHGPAIGAVVDGCPPGLAIDEGLIQPFLDARRPGPRPRRELIRFVADRPGHDRRYAIDARKIERELGWRPSETFESGLRKTVRWYLEHADWTERVLSGAYRMERLGTA